MAGLSRNDVSLIGALAAVALCIEAAGMLLDRQREAEQRECSSNQGRWTLGHDEPECILGNPSHAASADRVAMEAP